MTKLTEVSIPMHLVFYDGNGYPEYSLVEPNTCCDDEFVCDVDAKIMVSKKLAEKITKSRLELNNESSY